MEVEEPEPLHHPPSQRSSKKRRWEEIADASLSVRDCSFIFDL